MGRPAERAAAPQARRALGDIGNLVGGNTARDHDGYVPHLPSRAPLRPTREGQHSLTRAAPRRLGKPDAGRTGEVKALLDNLREKAAKRSTGAAAVRPAISGGGRGLGDDRRMRGARTTFTRRSCGRQGAGGVRVRGFPLGWG